MAATLQPRHVLQGDAAWQQQGFMALGADKADEAPNGSQLTSWLTKLLEARGGGGAAAGL